MKRCLHQLKRPDRKDLSKQSRVGECSDCEFDENENKKCKKYTPINIEVFEVIDHQKES